MISFLDAHRKAVFVGSMAAQWLIAVALAVAWWPHLRGLLAPSPLAIAAGLAAAVALIALRGRTVPALHVRRWRPRPVATKAAVLGAGAVAEEVIWRGVALFWLAAAVSPVVAVVVTTLGFAGAHVFAQGWPGFRRHLITGLVLAVPALVLGSVLLAAIAHVGYNWTLIAFDEEARATARERAAAQGTLPLGMVVTP